MKKSFLPLIAALAIVAPALTGCGGSSSSSSSGEISDFAVAQVFKRADKNYRVVFDSDTAYYDISTTLQWPMALGDADIEALRDSLLSLSYGPAALATGSPDKAILTYLSDPALLDSVFSPAAITPVDSVPADYQGMRSWFNNVSATVVDMNERTVSYQVVNSSYTGGAHPNEVAYPFTYDLKTGTVLTFDNMFVPGSRQAIMGVIIDALARQYNVTPATLDDAMIWRNSVTYPGRPYVTQEGVVFHYNPYEIGPYALGSVDVTVYPYELESYMTPELKSIFDAMTL